VNWRHLEAFIWLRWRPARQPAQKGGDSQRRDHGHVRGGRHPGRVHHLSTAFAVGMFRLAGVRPSISRMVVMFVWTGCALLFLFSWTIGLLAELQRSEALSIDRFLHLPVSPSGVS